MTPIIISAECIPDPTTILGYSGGMALYVANWHSLMYLFYPIRIVTVAYWGVQSNSILN